MENALVESKAKMSFHLEGENEIDAKLLSNLISNMAEYTKEITKNVHPEAYLKMNVTTFRDGSFEIIFSAVCQTAESLFNTIGSVATPAEAIITSLVGGIALKQHLKGKKAKSINKKENGKIEVEAQNGSKIILPAASECVIENVHIDQLIVNISQSAKEHNPKGGFSLSHDKEQIYCSAEDISVLARPSEITEVVTGKRQRVEAVLLIRKAAFDGASKWGFDYNGAIEASIEDEDFLNWFKHNGTVSIGDYIEATMEVYVELDIMGYPIKGKEKYTIIKVHGGIKHNLDLENYSYFT